MTTGDLERLRRLLGVPETEWIVDRARTRLAKGTALDGSITLSRASDPQRAAAGRLLGRSVGQGRSVTVSLGQLDQVLRTSGAWPEGLAAAVVALKGPVDDPAERQALRDAWRAVDYRLVELAAERLELKEWVQRVRSRGHLKRIAGNAEDALALVDDLTAVVRALPTEGESLAGFAARVLHRAHALDAGTALGNLAADAAGVIGTSAWAGETGEPVLFESELFGIVTHSPVDSRLESSVPVTTAAAAAGKSGVRRGTAAWRRYAWASVGVLVDDLSSSVLTLGLPGGTSSPTAYALAQLSGAGQPVVLTLRQVMADDPGVIPSVVYVCENPAVVSAAADQLGSASSPVVCVGGQPGSAAVALLNQLGECGAALRYHGDFDWGGISIARTMTSQVGWEPWRFRAADYMSALEGIERTGCRLEKLAEPHGGVPGTPWDPELSTTMAHHGLRIEEEFVLDDLLRDLAD
ncbi:TIGR02679 family protein [Phytoactinopolyspora sp. XMNu-373]|uniref:TIGR02679 family protein n=2 Tax=Phytoactinopolyspora mesophila TaxID=2650750 RepID=A0A7K3LXR0_9ACTN|nr:TIGR02679 family protein [Phytoactinopolyspora mesophila]